MEGGTADENLSYPRDLESEPVDEKNASIHLARWLGDAYEYRASLPKWHKYLNASFSGASATPGAETEPRWVVWPSSTEWQDIRRSGDLATWIWIVSRDERIGQVYGKTIRLFDGPYFDLEAEAFLFLNTMLRKYEIFDAASALAEASSLWHDIASGDETDEVGAIVMNLVLDGSVEELALGRRLTLHRVAGEWAEARFEHAGNLPGNRWAVVSNITRRRAAFGRLHEEESQLRMRDDIGSELRQQSLLPLRIVSPAPYWLGSEYSVQVRGSWWPARKAFFYSRYWSDGEARFSDYVLGGEEATELSSIGRILSEKSPFEDTAGQPSALDPLTVALTSFNSSFQRKNWRDGVIDLAVMLETLLGGGGAGISYRAGIRAALLLGRATDDSWRTYEQVDALYNLRSKVVHGDLKALKSATFGAAVALSNEEPRTIDKTDLERNGRRAVLGGQRLCARVIGSMLHLSDDGGFALSKSGETGFLTHLDKSAFEPALRDAIRRAAHTMGTP